MTNTAQRCDFEATTPVSAFVTGAHVRKTLVGHYGSAYFSVFETDAVTLAEPVPLSRPRRRIPLKSLISHLDDKQRSDIESARRRMLASMLHEVASGRLSPLTYHRVSAGLTQSALAEKSGLQQSKISLLESNPSRMTARAARQLARVFNIDFRELLR